MPAVAGYVSPSVARHADLQHIVQAKIGKPGLAEGTFDIPCRPAADHAAISVAGGHGLHPFWTPSRSRGDGATDQGAIMPARKRRTASSLKARSNRRPLFPFCFDICTSCDQNPIAGRSPLSSAGSRCGTRWRLRRPTNVHSARRPYCVRSRWPACRFRTLRPSTPDALVGAGEAETRMVSAGGCREAAARGSQVPAVSARPERSCARSR